MSYEAVVYMTQYMKQSIIGSKSFEFSVQLVTYLFELDPKLFNPVYKQLLCSGTSIWANVQEALWWQSRADFIHKLGIAQKECRETVYRLKILIASRIWESKKRNEFLTTAEELLAIITSILITTKKNNQ